MALLVWSGIALLMQRILLLLPDTLCLISYCIIDAKDDIKSSWHSFFYQLLHYWCKGYYHFFMALLVWSVIALLMQRILLLLHGTSCLIRYCIVNAQRILLLLRDTLCLIKHYIIDAKDIIKSSWHSLFDQLLHY